MQHDVLRSRILNLMALAKLQAENTAKRSACKRHSVGVTAFDPTDLKRAIILSEYNRPPEGIECTGEMGNCGCQHAEALLLSRMLSEKIRPNLIVYCTVMPCPGCFHLLQVSNAVHGVIYETSCRHEQWIWRLSEKTGLPMLHSSVITNSTEAAYGFIGKYLERLPHS